MSGLNDLRELAIHSLLNPGATVAVIDRLIAAEQRVAELEHNAADREKRLQARLNACKSVKAIWKERAWTAEEELARRDAAAGEPVAWMNTREGDPTWPRVFINKMEADKNRNWVELNPMVQTRPLFTAAQPAAGEPVGLLEHCEKASEIVGSWPQWKQDGSDVTKFITAPPAALPSPLDNWHNSASGVMASLNFIGDEMAFTVGANWMLEQAKALWIKPIKLPHEANDKTFDGLSTAKAWGWNQYRGEIIASLIEQGFTVEGE